MEPAGVYHFNPLDSSTVGKLIEKHKSTILLATPTFLRSYMKRCSVEQMSSLNMVIVGAEKMPDELRDAFRERFVVGRRDGHAQFRREIAELQATSPDVAMQMCAQAPGPGRPRTP